MGWSIGFDSHWQRDIGYGVPAECDHPRCRAFIDRGLAYVCGGEPYGGDLGCGLYFCGAHQVGEHQRCLRCVRRRKPYQPKQDVEAWTIHKLTERTAMREPRETALACILVGQTSERACTCDQIDFTDWPDDVRAACDFCRTIDAVEAKLTPTLTPADLMALRVKTERLLDDGVDEHWETYAENQQLMADIRALLSRLDGHAQEGHD